MRGYHEPSKKQRKTKVNVIHGSRPITIVTETEAGSSRPSNSDFRDSSDFKFRHLWEPSVSKPQKDVGENLSEEIEVSVVFFCGESSYVYAPPTFETWIKCDN